MILHGLMGPPKYSCLTAMHHAKFLWSSSPGTSLPRGPLRTGRATFAASGSSRPTGQELANRTGSSNGGAPSAALGVDETVGGGFARRSRDSLASHRAGDALLLPCESSVGVTTGIVEEQRAARCAQSLLGSQDPERATGERRRVSSTSPGPVVGQGGSSGDALPGTIWWRTILVQANCSR